jgi:hypothetical protein
MNRERALAALDKAIDDEVALLFKNLVSAIIAKDVDGGNRFGEGMKNADISVSVATHQIETIFPE